MRKQTYKEMQQQVANLNNNIEIMDAVIKAGIPQSKAHYIFDFVGEMFSVSSGYSMGEMVYICVNGVRVISINQEQEYAKSCKWSAKHGRVVINLKKKDFAELIDIAMRREKIREYLVHMTTDKGELHKKLVELHDKAADIAKQSVDMSQSVVKKYASTNLSIIN